MRKICRVQHACLYLLCGLYQSFWQCTSIRCASNRPRIEGTDVIIISLINLIHDVYRNSSTRIKVGGELTESITSSNIRRGDSLSPMLFNGIMDHVIESVKGMKRYKIGWENMKIFCYASAVLDECQNDLQKILHKLVLTEKMCNMEVSKGKTKYLTIPKETFRM